MKDSVIVFATKRSIAETKMRELIVNFKEQILLETKDKIETENKLFRARSWQQNQRAIKANDLYIDKNISEEEINTYILPCLVQKRVSGDIYEMFKYNWKDHVHYFEGNQ